MAHFLTATMSFWVSSKFRRLIVIYVIWTITWVVFRWLNQDRLWLFSILNLVAEYYFLPLPLLILIRLTRRDKQSLVLLSIPCVIFLRFWGPLYLPKIPPSTAENAPILQVMTYNVLVSNRDPQKVVDTILDAAPDVIGFEELSVHNIPTLRVGLSSEYEYHTFDFFSGSRSDVGLVSHFPIISAERFSFPPEERAIHTIIDWNGQHVHIFVVHLTANNLMQNSLTGVPALAAMRFGNRAFQIQRIHEEASKINEPILVLCDCNMLDTSTAYSEMASTFSDSFRESGWGSGHTSIAPFPPLAYQRIDYIWHSAEFTSLSSHVGENQSSDHYPLISTLTLSSQR